MNRTAHPLRVTAAVALSLATMLTAACGDARTSGASSPPDGAGLDQSLHHLLPASVRARGVLVVGTDASYAPMSSFAPDGRTIVGVEPDLGSELGRVLGVKVRFVNNSFTTLLPRVADGRLDLAMSAITDTSAREKQDDFVNYFSAGTSIVVQRGNPSGVTDIQDLCGKVVAVEKGTTQVDLLARSQGNCVGRRMVVRTFATNSDALLRLRTGRAAAVLNDLPPAALLANDPGTKSDYQLASTTQYEPGLYGVAVAKNRAGLRDAVHGAFEKLLHNGGYLRVLQRWSVANGAVVRISVNSDR